MVVGHVGGIDYVFFKDRTRYSSAATRRNRLHARRDPGIFGEMSGRKITFLFGAGASVPFLRGLSTPLITAAYLHDNQRWRDVWSLFNKWRKRRDRASPAHVLDHLNIKEILRLRDDIGSLLAGNRQAGNFEAHIHLLDKATAHLQAHRPGEDFGLDSLLCTLSDPKCRWQRTFKRSNRDGWRYGPFLAREIVCSVVLEHWIASEPERASAIKLHQDFFDGVLGMFEHVHLYSLNYDPLLYEAVKEMQFSSGFRVAGAFDEQRFSVVDSRTLAFVHGHVGFAPDTTGNTLFHLDWMDAQRLRIKAAVDGHVGNWTSKGLDANTMIVTGFDKIHGFARDPYSSYLHSFALDVLDCDCLVLVGVSLGDDHLNAFLRNSLRKGREKAMVVVDLVQPDEVEELLSSVAPTEKMATILSVLRDTFGPDLEKHWQQLAGDLGTMGYGRLSHNTMLFSRGTEEFYKHGLTDDLLGQAA